MPKQQAKQEALPFTVHKLETVAKDDHTLFDTQNLSLADPLLRPTRLSLFLADDLGEELPSTHYHWERKNSYELCLFVRMGYYEGELFSLLDFLVPAVGWL